MPKHDQKEAAATERQANFVSQPPVMPEKSRKEVEDNEERLKILFENAPDAIYLSDMKGTFLDGNRKAEELAGYKRGELIGKSFLKLNLLMPGDIPRAAKSLAKAILGQATGPEEYTVRRKDGATVIVEIKNYPVKIKNKTVIMGIARDISERKKAAEKIKTYLDIAGVIIVALGIDGTVNLINKKGRDILGYRKKEIIGKNWFELVISRKDRANIIKVHKENLLIENNEVVIENNIVTKSGNERIIAWHNTRLVDDGGKVIGTLSSGEDITEKKEIENKLHESNEMLQRIINLLPTRIFWKDKNLNYLGCNQIFAEDAGKTSTDEVIGRTDYQMGWKEQAELYRSDDLSVIKSGKSKIDYIEPQTSSDGKRIWLQTTKLPLTNKNGELEGILGAYLDITKTKKIEEELRKRNLELEKANKLMVGREMRMIELKKRIRELENK